MTWEKAKKMAILSILKAIKRPNQSTDANYYAQTSCCSTLKNCQNKGGRGVASKEKLMNDTPTYYSKILGGL